MARLVRARESTAACRQAHVPVPFRPAGATGLHRDRSAVAGLAVVGSATAGCNTVPVPVADEWDAEFRQDLAICCSRTSRPARRVCSTISRRIEQRATDRRGAITRIRHEVDGGAEWVSPDLDRLQWRFAFRAGFERS